MIPLSALMMPTETGPLPVLNTGSTSTSALVRVSFAMRPYNSRVRACKDNVIICHGAGDLRQELRSHRTCGGVDDLWRVPDPDFRRQMTKFPQRQNLAVDRGDQSRSSITEEPLQHSELVVPPRSSVFTAGGIFLALAALYFGRAIFVPFALAILLAFAIAPLVDWLRRFKVPRILAVLLAVSLAVLIIGGVSLVIGGQLIELASSVPSYKQTISTKLRSLRSLGLGDGALEQATHTVEDLSRELTNDGPASNQQPTTSPTQRTQRRPVPVVVERPEMRPLEILKTIVGPLIAALATAGLVVVFVIFVLLERTDLRDRFIRLVSHGDLQTSTRVLDDAAERVSRYLLMQLVVNICYGLPVAIGLYLIGVPNALLWGLLATVLRFIPYLGPFLATLFPAVLAFAIDPGWTMLLWVITLFVVIELIIANAVEPWLYGSSTGLIPIVTMIDR